VDSHRIRNLAGQLSLAETIQLLANAELVVSNDTAPLHMALTTPARVVGLFGPTRGETYVAPRRGAAMAQEHLYCSPCVHHWEPPPCGGDNQCMKRLSPTRVFALCCAVLGMAPPQADEVNDGTPAPTTFYPGLVYRRPARQGQL
jgi:heptosyltransferase-2